MKKSKNYCFIITLILSNICLNITGVKGEFIGPIEDQIQMLNEKLTESEKIDDLKSFLQLYNHNIISMPEYQSCLDGIEEVEIYYREIFRRQKVRSFKRKAEEYIHMGTTIIEIGTFIKEYSTTNSDSITTQKGKYWNVWKKESNGGLKIKGESFGFFHPISNPEALVVQIVDKNKESLKSPLNIIPFEMKAYNALMEKGVRERNGILRSEFFTKDGSFFPFAGTTISGFDNLKKYLIKYNSGGVKIDSISVYTYHCQYSEPLILEYTKFSVHWSIPPSSGKSQGGGIRIWKRQADKSIKIFREISTHNHLY